jgi:hypothetical protein
MAGDALGGERANQAPGRVVVRGLDRLGRDEQADNRGCDDAAPCSQPFVGALLKVFVNMQCHWSP